MEIDHEAAKKTAEAKIAAAADGFAGSHEAVFARAYLALRAQLAEEKVEYNRLRCRLDSDERLHKQELAEREAKADAWYNKHQEASAEVERLREALENLVRYCEGLGFDERAEPYVAAAEVLKGD